MGCFGIKRQETRCRSKKKRVVNPEKRRLTTRFMGLILQNAATRESVFFMLQSRNKKGCLLQRYRPREQVTLI